MKQRANIAHLVHLAFMATEMDLFLDRLREALRAYLDRTGETHESFGDRVGLSRSHITNLLNEGRSPSTESIGKILDGAQLRIVEVLGRSAPDVATVGTIAANGVLSFTDGETVMGKFELIEASDDEDFQADRMTVLEIHETDEPVVDRWNAIRTEAGEVVLMRATSSGDDVHLRVMGQRRREVYEPGVHAVLGWVAWERRPSR